MELEETKMNCQLPCLQSAAEGVAQGPPESLGRRLKLLTRRRLSPSRERAFKSRTNDIMNQLCRLTGTPTKPASVPAPVGLQAGDRVRVRSLEEIKTTLNHWRQLKGCTFMPEMAEYCNTIHRVLKPMKRFVDERDLRVKKSTGIVLLEGVMCKGTADFGSCDRSCFVFWREEWLEKIENERRG